MHQLDMLFCQPGNWQQFGKQQSGLSLHRKILSLGIWTRGSHLQPRFDFELTLSNIFVKGHHEIV